MSNKIKKASIMQRTGMASEDFYFNQDGFMVFTEEYHRKRGYCCKNGCLHCPFGYKKN